MKHHTDIHFLSNYSYEFFFSYYLSGSTESELLKLQQEKLRAMDLRDSFQRLDNSLEFVKDNISRVAAKLAIQSVEMQ